jgi:hypothetical protein
MSVSIPFIRWCEFAVLRTWELAQPRSSSRLTAMITKRRAKTTLLLKYTKYFIHDTERERESKHSTEYITICTQYTVLYVCTLYSLLYTAGSTVYHMMVHSLYNSRVQCTEYKALFGSHSSRNIHSVWKIHCMWIHYMWSKYSVPNRFMSRCILLKFRISAFVLYLFTE